MKYRILPIIVLLALMLASITSVTAQDNSAFPVTIEHKFGTTVITEEPQRIVSLGYTEQDTLFALGIQPVAVREWYGAVPYGIFPWAIEEAGDAQPEVLEMAYGNLNYEAILALQPDLISAVDSGITQEEYDTLSAIAPTIAQPDEYIDFGTPWQEVTRIIGAATGRIEEAETLITDLEARFIAIREANPQFADSTIAIAYHTGETYGYYTSEDSRGRFFADLGFVVPDELNELAGDDFYYYLSEERIDLLDQDLLLFLGLQFYEDGSEAARTLLEGDLLLSQLNAVQDERILFVSDELDNALQFSTILSIDFLLDGLVPEIASTIPNENETVEASCEEGLRAVEDAIGTVVCLPEQPERIISLTDGDTDALLALGIEPVGVSNGRGSDTPPRYLIDYLAEDYVSVGAFFQPNLEIVLELEPDLILFSYGDYAEPELMEQLNAIAPVFVPVGGDDGWQDLFVAVGEAVNMEAEVDTFFTDYESRIAELNQTVEADTQFLIARWSAEGPQVMAPYIFAPAILQEIGLVMPDEIPDLQEGHAHSAPLSLETLNILDTDWLFMGTLQAEGEAAEALESVFENPIFQTLEVVQNDQVVVVDGSIWTSSGGPLAANIVLDIIETSFAGE